MIRPVARVLVVAFCWMTTLHALVASSTFAYLQFLRPRVFPWTGTFADWHATAAWAWLVLLCVATGRDLTRPWSGRLMARVLVALATAAVIANTVRPTLPALANDAGSLTVAALALLPVVCLAWLDIHAHRGLVGHAAAVMTGGTDGADGDADLLNASVVTAVALAGLHAVLALARLATQFEPDLMGIGLIVAFGHSVVSHLVVLVPVFLVAALVSRLAGQRRGRSFWIWSAVLSIGVAVLFDRLINNALMVPGLWRPGLAVLAAAAVVGTWAGLQLNRRARQSLPVVDGLSLYFGMPVRQRHLHRLVALLGIAVLAWLVQRATAIADWDDVVLRLGTTVVWALVCGWAYRTVAGRPSRRNRQASNGRVVLVCVAPLVALALTSPSEDVRRALGRYPVYDPSYRVARGLITTEAGTPAFIRYLRANTGLTDVEIAPRSIDQVSPLPAVPDARRPPVFLFVVDSLRHDYLGAYNPKVRFTPNLDAFATDSVVFTNAFTRYGGTGLSVPAIWAGSALPHKQYVTPFAPMNGLEKLLDVNAYRRYISLDSIMVRLLQPSPLLDELDKGVTVMDYELCNTLSELEGRLAAAPAGTPLFAYSLPQDVHMSRLSRWTTPSGDFAGFFAPYAGRIQAMDACFGRFIATLRRLNLYDRSLIILTSDHGEMLGEDGQFGHSYHMFPAVVRVPLIVHLPAAAAAARRVDPEAVALSTDITPTIYAALGYALAPQGRLLGRPLIGEDDGALARRRRGRHVLAASYGAVYAVVSRNGRRLYVADGVKAEDHLYERTASASWTERDVPPDVRAIEQYAIRQHIDEVARVFAVPERESR